MTSTAYQRFAARWIRDVGIDLGTASTLIHVAGRGVMVREPSVVAVDRGTHEVVAVGEEAKRMLGRTPASIEAVRPMRDGVIADYDHAERMLKSLMRRVSRGSTLRTTVVVGVPSGITEVERRAVLEAARRSGASQAFLLAEPVAAAMGAGLSISEPTGTVVVDIGGGTTDIAVIAVNDVVYSRSISTAGDEMDQAILTYVRRSKNLEIGERTAERIKKDIGSAMPMSREYEIPIRGRDLATGLPKASRITSEEVRDAIAVPVQEIVRSIRLSLEEIPPEMAGDVMKRGICLAGGGALLQGLGKLIQRESGIAVHVPDDPEACVVKGTGIAVERLRTSRAMRQMVERFSVR